ncbi:MAG: precorrin-2 C(20)-methyltransferase [Propionibacteriaceae bacterium]|jgi:precorrin-2/cobalt-factor-2 C20-methyltransferase|nr:precorrin-2 C(20)-methyltransferase [Propionibacteriaceae bacterium]
MDTPTTAASHRLIGVGVGPGDPELVTVKAVRVLGQADVILVPTTEVGDVVGRAEAIVRAACPRAVDRVRRVPFSMAERRGVGPKRAQAWLTSAEAVEQAFNLGASTVAFATIGDPCVYSTFAYLTAHVRAAVADVTVEIIPGITAMQALAATAEISLVEGQETLTLAPATAPPEVLEAVLTDSDSVVFYKIGRRGAAITQMLADHHRADKAVVGVDIGLPDQRITALSDLDPADLPYFSTIIAAATRTSTGGRL